MSFFQFFVCASWIVWNLMDVIRIWSGNEDRNGCVAVFCPMSVSRVAVTGSGLVFLQNTGPAVVAARADRGVSVPVPTPKRCSARLNQLRENTGLCFMWNPAPFSTYGVSCVWRIKLLPSFLVQICYSKVSRWYFEQFSFFLFFFFTVIALLDWVFLNQMQSSHFSNLYCLFCIDSS